MPPFETFRDAESHAATLAHELTHWTRHPSRLNRDFGRKMYGDEVYPMEEFVAELGSAFLCADLQITPEVRKDHASCIDSWQKVLKDDERAVLSAARSTNWRAGCTAPGRNGSTLISSRSPGPEYRSSGFTASSTARRRSSSTKQCR
jgi:antirestriction protein ArdC